VPVVGVCCFGAGGGLQYGLSGNRAAERAFFENRGEVGFKSSFPPSGKPGTGDTPNVDLKGNRLAGNGR